MVRISLICALMIVVSSAFAEDTKPWTVDMTTPLVDSGGKQLKDCPAGFDPKVDPKQEGCPALTLAAAASYGVSFAVDGDRSLDWKQKAELRATLDRYHNDKAAALSHKQADALMDRIGNIYKLLPQGDQIIVAAMKILQPAEFSKLNTQ